MTFNLNETYWQCLTSKWRYLTSKSPKIVQIEVFGHFLDFASLVLLDFAHNNSWAWCLVVFLQFALPVHVFLLLNIFWAIHQELFFVSILKKFAKLRKKICDRWLTAFKFTEVEPHDKCLAWNNWYHILRCFPK